MQERERKKKQSASLALAFPGRLLLLLLLQSFAAHRVRLLTIYWADEIRKSNDTHTQREKEKKNQEK
jgi:hypothetical protein